MISDDDAPRPVSHDELSDLVRDLILSKSNAELLASIPKDKNLLSDSARIKFYRRRYQEYLHFFNKEKDLMYCTGIAQLLHKLGITQCQTV